jgi:hypothetical protein
MYDQNRIAQMLVVGFVKGWDLRTVLNAGTSKSFSYTDEEWPAEVHKACQFMPSGSPFVYKQQTSQYVCAQFPRLGAFLMKHLKTPEKLLSVVPQIERLKFDDTIKVSMRTRAELSEQQRINNGLKSKRAGNRASWASHNSHSRSAWNVCKA